MKLLITAHRMDEVPIYDKVNEAFGFDISYTPERLTKESAGMASGFDAAAITADCRMDRELLGILHDEGVRYILARSAGVDNIDLSSAHALGMQVANVPGYSPNAISEHTVLLVLMMLRKMRTQMERIGAHDFRILGLRAKQLSSQTVGVVGAGRIGSTTIKLLSGFGCRILANDIYENEEVKKYASYVPLDRLFAESDVIILHAPMILENYHMIGKEQIQKMKDGVLLVNTARGGLVDSEAVLEALESGKIGGFAFDVYEYESRTQRKDLRGKSLEDPVLEKLLSCEQVVYTTHTAFYTDDAVEAIARTTLQNLADFEKQGRSLNEK